MRPPDASLSHELMGHHVAEHARKSPMCAPVQLDEVPCPCESTVALMCAHCKGALFMGARDGTWCEHADALWRQCGDTLT